MKNLFDAMEIARAGARILRKTLFVAEHDGEWHVWDEDAAVSCGPPPPSYIVRYCDDCQGCHVAKVAILDDTPVDAILSLLLQAILEGGSHEPRSDD